MAADHIDMESGPSKWARTLSILLVGLVALLAGGCGGLSGVVTTTPSGSSPLPLTSTSIPASSRSTTTTTTTVPPTTSSTTTTIPPPTTTTTLPPLPPGPALSLGDTGPQVLALQQRLVALGYWLGTPYGVFGDSTEQAVYALQKAGGITRDGVVGPATEKALNERIVPHPRSTTGYVVEVDLTDDVIMIVDNGKLLYIFNTSTGGGYTYVGTGGVVAIADTPVGVFHVYTEVDGMVTDSLGQLWRPKYFYSGFAIHGDSYVPPYPVSHGCVRVSDEAIDWIWQANVIPIGTEVWVY